MLWMDILSLIEKSKKKNTKVINFKTDEETKNNFFEYCKDKGVTPSLILNNFIKSISKNSSTILDKEDITILKDYYREYSHINKSNPFKGDFINIGSTIIKDKEEEIIFSENDFLDNMIILGQTGSGKSVLVMQILNKLVSNKRGFLFLNRDIYDLKEINNIALEHSSYDDFFSINISDVKYNKKENELYKNNNKRIHFLDWIGLDNLVENILGKDNSFFINNSKSILRKEIKDESIFTYFSRDRDFPNRDYLLKEYGETFSYYFFDITFNGIKKLIELSKNIYVDLDEDLEYCFINNKMLVINANYFLHQSLSNLLNLKIKNTISEEIKIKNKDEYKNKKMVNNKQYYLFLSDSEIYDNSPLDVDFIHKCRLNQISLISCLQCLTSSSQYLYNNSSLRVFLKTNEQITLSELRSTYGVEKVQELNVGYGYIGYRDNIIFTKFNYFNFEKSFNIPTKKYISKDRLLTLSNDFSKTLKMNKKEISLVFENSSMKVNDFIEDKLIVFNPDEKIIFSDNVFTEDIISTYKNNIEEYLSLFSQNNIENNNEVILNSIENNIEILKISNLNFKGSDSVKIILNSLLSTLYQSRNELFEKFYEELIEYCSYVKYQETFVLIIFKLLHKYYFNIPFNTFTNSFNQIQLKAINPQMYFALDSIDKEENIHRGSMFIWFDFYLIEKEIENVKLKEKMSKKDVKKINKISV